jgi:CTD small phosphatase-like protein 2
MALKGSRTIKSMLFHEYFIQNTKYLAVMHMKKINKPPESEIEHLKVYLPPRNSDKTQFKRTLLLDLDETLIHCFTQEEFDISPHVPDLNLQITGPDDEKNTISISIRPYAYEFLQEMSKIFEIAIFTASSPLYANKVLDILDPNNQIFTFRIFR